MSVDATGQWSSPEPAGERLSCPACGNGLPAGSFAAGQRLVRCRQCGQVVRRNWPEHPSAALESRPSGATRPATAIQPGPQLEIVPLYPYPVLTCPYCEYANQDLPGQPDGKIFCANCGADLKKTCLNCDASLYVLDHFCPRCRGDQDRLKYEIEAMYWQHFNEGKRLAQLGRWADAERELSLFFNPPADLDRQHVRRARQIYISSIAPQDGGEGLRLYNETVEQLRLAHVAELKRQKRRKLLRAASIALGVALLVLLSSAVLGSPVAIFIIAPLAAFLLALLVLYLLGSLGLA